jgi:hypothetical protein
MSKERQSRSDAVAEPLYFVMACDAVSPATMIRRETKWSGMPWMTGAMISNQVPNPVVFAADASYPGELLAMYDDSIPIMRDDLIDILVQAGVDNLQTFPALVRNLDGSQRSDYKAVNIVGVVAAADMEHSTLMEPAADFLGADFESLVIDERRAAGPLIFRLAEAANAIVVHRSVRDRVAGNIRGMSFYGPGQWAG